MFHIWAKTEKADHSLLRLLMKEISRQNITQLTNQYSRDKSKLSLLDYAQSNHNTIRSKVKAIVNPIIKKRTDRDIVEANEELVNGYIDRLLQ